MSDPLYELAQLIADCEAVLEGLLLVKALHVKVADLSIDGQPATLTVPGYGTVGASNPDDSDIEGWDAEACDAFAQACKGQAEAMQAGGPG